MIRQFVKTLWTVLVCLTVATAAFAQGATSTLSGTVVDTGGGVLPGATVVVKNNATNVSFTTVTNTTGAFSVPALDPGAYTVTVSLSGFKTGVVNDVRVLAATPASVAVTLEVGALSETVNVTASSELVQTQSPAVSTTIQVDQINKLPLATRNALNYITLLPGVDTVGVNRDSTISGLPQSMINITIDGVNVQDNYLRSTDGFFARVTPRQDAVEQVTVTTAAQDAGASGQGAAQIAFVTRSGTNQFKGTAYHYFRHPSLNTNYWFNKRDGLDKNRVILNQYGFSEGGPIVIPGLFDGRGKAFFFFNYEEFRQPTERTATRTILTPEAQSGLFRYNTSAGVRTVSVFDVARSAGQLTAMDPTIQTVLAQIQSATGTTGTISDTTDPNTLSYRYQTPADQLERQPTVRVDWNLGTRHRLSASYNWEVVIRDPDFLNNADATFPGFPNYRYYESYRPSTSFTLRSTLSSNMVNELRVGGAWGRSSFGLGNINETQFDNSGGFFYTWGNSMLGLTSPHIDRNPSERDGYNFNIDETLNWQRGNHSLSFGGSFSRFNSYVNSRLVVPALTFDVDTTNDPAAGMFNTTNFPGASNTSLQNARRLYALLTGRIVSIGGDIRLNEDTNEYQYLGLRSQRGQLHDMGFFAQDAWRVTPTLTLNAGVRWQLQLPFSALNDVFSMATIEDICGISGVGSGPGGRDCNLFNPDASGGAIPTYEQYDRGNPGYSTDWNNVAPNVGVAWRPNVEAGFLRTILGDPEQATVRAGFSVAYNRNGMEDVMGVYAANPGSAVTVNRNASNGNLVYPGESWPVLLSQPERLGPPAFPARPEYPVPSTIATSVNILHPDLEVPYARSFNIGFQRALSNDMAVEVRYVGTRTFRQWSEENWNEVNVFENGFLDEFRLAQQNLQSHIAAGCGQTGAPACSFAYRGAGTSPLPIYLAYFSGRTDTDNAAAYSSGNFTNAAWTGHLGVYEPDPLDAASDLHANATLRNNAINAGLSRNFFRLNPDASSANVTMSSAYSKYDSLQVDLRRRLSQGFFLNANYTLGFRYGSSLPTLRQDRVYVQSTTTPRHAFKFNWTYEVPVGRGRRFGTDMNAWLDGLVGNWEFSGTGRIQSGRLVSASNVRLVGMTMDELQDAYRIRIDNSGERAIVYLLPQDIIDNTRRAFDTSATSPTGYGSLGPPEGRYLAPASQPGCVRVYPTDCGEPRNVYLTGPMFARVDVAIKKTFPIAGRVNAQLEIDVLNLFDNVNFTPVFNPTSATLFQVNAAYQDLSNTFDPGGRLGQVIWRVNW